MQEQKSSTYESEVFTAKVVLVAVGIIAMAMLVIFVSGKLFEVTERSYILEDRIQRMDMRLRRLEADRGYEPYPPIQQEEQLF